MPLPVVFTSDRKIYKMTQYDVVNTTAIPLSATSVGNIYYCTDTHNFYEDKNGLTGYSRDLITGIRIIDTELRRTKLNNPNNFKYYYVVETNELWYYTNSWILIIGRRSNPPSAYIPSFGSLRPSPSDESDPSAVQDNNGLLKDGSVVVRDHNRIIKGRVSIDESDNYLSFNGFTGGGIKFSPTGQSYDENGAWRVDVVPTDPTNTVDYEGKFILKGHYYEINPDNVPVLLTDASDNGNYDTDTHTLTLTSVTFDAIYSIMVGTVQIQHNSYKYGLSGSTMTIVFDDNVVPSISVGDTLTITTAERLMTMSQVETFIREYVDEYLSSLVVDQVQYPPISEE